MKDLIYYEKFLELYLTWTRCFWALIMILPLLSAPNV